MVGAVAGELGAGFAQRKREFVCWFRTQGVALGWYVSPRWGDGLCGGFGIRRKPATVIDAPLQGEVKAMGYGDDEANEANEAIRLSWCHLTPEVDWEAVVGRIRGLR